MILDHLNREWAHYLAAGAEGRFCYTIVDTNQQPNLNVVLEGKSLRARPLSKTAPDGPVLAEVEIGGSTPNWLLIPTASAHDSVGIPLSARK